MNNNKKKKQRRIILDILALCDEAYGAKDPVILPAHESSRGVAFVTPIEVERVLDISTLRVHISKDLRTKEEREKGARVLREVQRRFGCGGPPLLDPEKDMKITSEEYHEVVQRLEKIQHMLETHPVKEHGEDLLVSRLKALRHKMDIKHNCRLLRQDIQKAQGLVLVDDLQARLRVLNRLGYLEEESIVSTKGKTAAEISTGDELVMCELLFSGAFGPLKVDQVAALVSCFIWREKSEARAKVPHEMEGPYGLLRDSARKIARAESECDMGVDIEEYVDSFKPDLMSIVIEWCHGATFAHIAALAGDKTHGGSLVRAIRRLEELLRQVSSALKLIGDTTLAEKFDTAIEKIKRDIIFAASLFL